MSDYVDEMVDAYVECLLWAGLDWVDKDEDDNPRRLDENYDADDLADEAWESIRADCQAFYDYHACILDWQRWHIPHYSPGQAGHDFYLTRNGHGAGFWDRGLGALGDILTFGAKPYGETNEYAQDGKIYPG